MEKREVVLSPVKDEEPGAGALTYPPGIDEKKKANWISNPARNALT